jgi:hypothetical protein
MSHKRKEQNNIPRKNKIFVYTIETVISFFISRFFTEYMLSNFPKIAHQPIIYLVFIIVLISLFTWFNKKIGMRS